MKKCKLNEFCEKAFINVENTKGKANKVTITIKDEESYKIKLVKQRTEKQKNNARVNKIKSMGIAKPNQDKLLRMLYEGKINNTHITNIIKADINDALARLPNKIQAKVIDTIIN